MTERREMRIEKLTKGITESFEISREEAMKRCNLYIPESVYLFMFYGLLSTLCCFNNTQYLESGDYRYFSYWENKQKKIITKMYIDEAMYNYSFYEQVLKQQSCEEQPECFGELSPEEISQNFRTDIVFYYFDLFIEIIKKATENNIVLFDKFNGVPPCTKRVLHRFDKESLNCGTIYVMKNCNYFKIGKAKRNSSRYGEYTKLPEEPIYLIKREDVFDYSNVEKIIHIIFKENRNRGGACEWFSLSEEDVKKIDMILDLFSVKNKTFIDDYHGETLWRIESIL